ncbi:MAG: carboxymuconolactone decarboxylase family protein [Clostridiales bacterium]|nr:carboxymuconolactone decarboxylase family protein [Clostridiales bacterium]
MPQVFYKKHYSLVECYNTVLKGVRTSKYLIKSKKSKEISKIFIEKIMLSVTEVNGCEMCSTGHTKVALAQGISANEINLILLGQTKTISNDESSAILFGKQYAGNKGKVPNELWQSVIDSYGHSKALGILGAIRMIMIGNIYGMALGALENRFKGKAIKNSSFIHEIAITLSLIVFLPIAIIHSLVLNLVKVPIISFIK